jgi:hypothetical protein
MRGQKPAQPGYTRAAKKPGTQYKTTEAKRANVEQWQAKQKAQGKVYRNSLGKGDVWTHSLGPCC